MPISKKRLAEIEDARTELLLRRSQITAKLRAIDGDVDGALAHAAEVANWTPANLTYRLLEVELHARLGRRQSAARTLQRIAREFELRSRSDPRFLRLRDALLPQ